MKTPSRHILPSVPRLKPCLLAGAASLALGLTSCQQVGDGVARVGEVVGRGMKGIQQGMGSASGSRTPSRASSTGSSPVSGVFGAWVGGDLGTILDVVVAASYGASDSQKQQAARKGSGFRSDKTAQKKFAAARSAKRVKYVAVKVDKDKSKSGESGDHVVLVNPDTGKPKSNKVYVAKKGIRSGGLVDIDGQKAMVYGG